MPVKDAKHAADIAREALKSAGLPLHIMVRIREQSGDWIVDAEAVGDKYQVRIESFTEKVKSLERTGK